MKGKGAWLVASYEIDMSEALSFEGPSAAAVRNALTESMVLHTRQLCEMFLSRSNEKDNVKLKDLIPERQHTARLSESVAALHRIYGNSRRAGSPCWVFNKMLLHPTTIRTDGYDYGSALNQVRPFLEEIIAEIESEKGPFERKLR